MEGIKKLEKKGDLTDDDLTELEAELQLLTDKQITEIEKMIEGMGADISCFVFNIGDYTAFDQTMNKIFIRNDVYPDMGSDNPFDRAAVQVVIAHEYFGHKLCYDKGYKTYPACHWFDECRASFMAAIHAKQLDKRYRLELLDDAKNRLKIGYISLTKGSEHALAYGKHLKINAFLRRFLYDRDND
jgi:hypothetical protein